MSVCDSIRDFVDGGAFEELSRVEPSRIKTTLDQVEPGDWFMPMTIKGVHPHDRIDEAIDKGAVGFFAESADKVSVSARGRVPHVFVSDLRATLFRLAEATRASHPSLQVAAVTGSNGKTTVKELVASIFREAGPAVWTLANLNTKIGIASTLLQLGAEDRRAIFEVGARKREDLIVPLRMTRPQVVGCLNIGEAHLGEFGGLSELLKTKLSIYKAPGLEACVANADDSRILAAAREAGVRLISFGESVKADIRVLFFHFEKGRERTRVGLRVHGQYREFWVRGCQRTHGINVAAAIAFAHAAGLENWEVIERGLREFAPPPQRFQIIPTAIGCVIDDSFNASPSSLKQGLATLAELFPFASKVLVLGSMLELGEESPVLHRECGEFLQRRVAPEHLLLVGPEARMIGEGAGGAGMSKKRMLYFEDTKSLLASWPLVLERAPVTYLKASRSVGLGAVAERMAGRSEKSQAGRPR